MMLCNRTYAGYVPLGRRGSDKLNRCSWYLGNHTPAVSPDDFETLQARRAQRTRATRESREPRTELAGMIVCGICGGAVTTDGRRNGHSQYLCRTAADQRGELHEALTRRDWMVHWALQEVLKRVLQELPLGDVPDDAEERRRAAERDITRIESRMKRLRDLYEAGEYNDDMAEYMRKKADYEAQLAVSRRDLQDTGPDSRHMRQLHQALADFHYAYGMYAGDIPSRQRLWRTFVKRVTLWPTHLHVELVNLGPGIRRSWRMGLPPKRTKPPGSKAGRSGAIVGEGKTSRNHLSDLKPEPISIT
jgi:hypothetical protein